MTAESTERRIDLVLPRQGLPDWSARFRAGACWCGPGSRVLLRPVALQPLVEGLLLVALTAAVCVATYEIVKRVNRLRPVFGLKG